MTKTPAFFCSILFFIISILGCIEKKPVWISADNPNIEYMGRIAHNDSLNAKELYWSGSSIKIKFSGSSVNAVMEDESGDNYYNVIVDEDSIYILKIESTKKKYSLCNLDYGDHTATIFKRTEWDRGKTIFYGFELGSDTEIAEKPATKKRKIEFYGNSITAGFGVEDYSGEDRYDSIFTNNYLTYAALTARHYGAEYHCTARSGIGIMISWFPVIMPEIFDRINPLDSNSKWDFYNFQADIVVINLLQNDSWLVNLPEHESFKLRFGKRKPNEKFIVDSYVNFVSDIRSKYPNASIICVLGSMDITRKGSVWPEYVTAAVAKLNDSKIFTHFIPYKNTYGHPRIDEQKQMAASLIQFIDKNIEW